MAKKLLKKKMDGGPIGKAPNYSKELPKREPGQTGYLVQVGKPKPYSESQKDSIGKAWSDKLKSPKSSGGGFFKGPKSGSKTGGGLRNGGKVAKKK